MRQDRAAFVEFFCGDELVLPPAEATERLNAYYRHRQEAVLARQPARRRPWNLPGLNVPAFELPPATEAGAAWLSGLGSRPWPGRPAAGSGRRR